jgi:alpha-tubulin suppressor-like RCC1 family protein
MPGIILNAVNRTPGVTPPVSAGELWAWGKPDGAPYFLRGTLGLGTLIGRSSPVQVGTLNTWKSISTSMYRGLYIGSGGTYTNYSPADAYGMPQVSGAIKSDNTLWTWGGGHYYFPPYYNNRDAMALGHGDGVTPRSSPVQVGSLSNWDKFSTGNGSISAAIKTDGTLWTWGVNSTGALGQNNTTNRTSPVQVGTGTDWSEISCGRGFCIALKTNGTLWSWGSGVSGALGLNSTSNRSSPTQIGSLTTWSKISTGRRHCLASKTDGTLWAWGNNQSGQLGQGNAINRSSPVQIGTGTNWDKVFTGSYNSFSIKTDGTLWVWGDNSGGNLGTGNIISRSSPVQLGLGTDWSKVASSSFNRHTLALKTDGTLWAWGRGNAGVLGQNNQISRSSPVQVGNLTTWIDIAAGLYVSFGIKTL